MPHISYTNYMKKTSGLLFFLGGLIASFGILISEIFYPVPYSVSKNYISNLGSTPPPGSVIFQPSASIFDLSLIVGGIMVIVGGILLIKSKNSALPSIAIILTGAGTTGVGLFPAFNIHLHLISAFTAFIAGGIAAILASRITKSPFSIISLLVGIFSLAMLATSLFVPNFFVPIFGIGGVERLIVYPEIIWLIAFGSYLLGMSG